jgi:hypothetical protein
MTWVAVVPLSTKMMSPSSTIAAAAAPMRRFRGCVWALWLYSGSPSGG